MVRMYHAGSAEQSGGRTHMHAHTDMYTLIRTTGIRHWLVLFVFVIGIWSWLSIGIDGGS